MLKPQFDCFQRELETGNKIVESKDTNLFTVSYDVEPKISNEPQHKQTNSFNHKSLCKERTRQRERESETKGVPHNDIFQDQDANECETSDHVLPDDTTQVWKNSKMVKPLGISIKTQIQQKLDE